MMQIKKVGRSNECEFVVLDPPRKVSRHHVDVIFDGRSYFLVDKSANGTFVNGSRLAKGTKVPVRHTDLIMLAQSYQLDLALVFTAPTHGGDETRILVRGNSDSTHNIAVNFGDKTVIFNEDKTQIGEILAMDNTGFITVGRSADNGFSIPNPSVSKKHCRLRMLAPTLVEIEDLGSSNGTFADGERLAAGERNRFASSVKVTLGQETILDLRKLFPKLDIPVKKVPAQNPPVNAPGAPTPGTPIKEEEKRAFNDLETVWREYEERQKKIANIATSGALGGSLFGGVLGIALPGVGALLGLGGSLLGRYISQQKVNKLRNDVSYEDMFLQVYACPRCKESFQKKPWVTIRDCMRCKIKFR